MGHDEHGPAYPEPPYTCPVCGWDATGYLRCNHPGCPDGRDRGHSDRRYFPVPREEPGDPHLDHAIGPRMRPDYLGLAVAVAIIFGLYWVFS